MQSQQSGGFMNMGTSITPLNNTGPEKFKQKQQTVDPPLSPFLSRHKENADEFSKFMKSTTPKDYYNILQHPCYYQNLSEMSYEVNAATSALSNDVQADIKMESDVTMKDELMVEDQYSQQSDDQGLRPAVYTEMFGSHKRKDARIGNNYQVNKVPLITDIQYFEYLQELDKVNTQACTLVWQPDKLSPETVDYYLKHMQLYWPYHLFHYQEEISLHFLHLKGYDVSLALMTVMYNQDQLVKLLKVTRKVRRAQGLFTNVLMKQNQKAQIATMRQLQNDDDVIRILRDRKQLCDYEELEMMLQHQQQHKLEDYTW